jgi:hypothetical protein
MAVAVGGMSATILPRVDEVLAAMRTLLSPWLESPGEVG